MNQERSYVGLKFAEKKLEHKPIQPLVFSI